MRIILARHGETIDNALGKLQGQLPGMLNTNGIAQSHKLGKALSSRNIDLIISSDLARSIHTAEIIMEHVDSPHIKDSLIREKDWGSYTGQKVANVDIYSPPSDAESNDKIYKRVKIFIDKIQQTHHDKSLLIIGHGITNQAIMAVLQNIPSKEMHTIDIQKNTDIWTWE